MGTPSVELRGNGSVKRVLKKDNTYYIFGAFTNLATNHGPGLVLDSVTHNIQTPQKWRINGKINTSAPDGQGGFYIGGSFTKIGDSVRNHFAHIDSHGQ